MKAFWTDDNAESRYLAEHGAVSRMDGDEMVIEAGNAELLPPWPPVEFDAPAIPLRPNNRTEHVGIITPRPTLCAVCATPVVRHGDAGWRHEVSYAERDGCQTPWPEG